MSINNISPELVDALFHGTPNGAGRVAGLTPDRFRFLAERARNDDELLGWLTPRSGNPLDVALRSAYAADGGRLHESDRIITGIAVPTDALRHDWTEAGYFTHIDPDGVVIPDGVPLRWAHEVTTRLGTVMGSERSGNGLRVWCDVDRGPVGDEVLRCIGFGELGLSVRFNDDENKYINAAGHHLHVGGQAGEVSLTRSPALGRLTRAERAPMPRRLAPTLSIREQSDLDTADNLRARGIDSYGAWAAR